MGCSKTKTVSLVPLLLENDPSLDLDELRIKLGFEVVAERDEGYVIV